MTVNWLCLTCKPKDLIFGLRLALTCRPNHLRLAWNMTYETWDFDARDFDFKHFTWDQHLRLAYDLIVKTWDILRTRSSTKIIWDWKVLICARNSSSTSFQDFDRNDLGFDLRTESRTWDWRDELRLDVTGSQPTMYLCDETGLRQSGLQFSATTAGVWQLHSRWAEVDR